MKFPTLITITILSVPCSSLLLINFLIKKNSFQDRKKVSPFECGFSPISNHHLPFSTQFFMISLIFLIFDIEIALLMPLIPLLKIMNLSMIYSSLLFMVVLIYGLYVEYLEESLEWKI